MTSKAAELAASPEQLASLHSQGSRFKKGDPRTAEAGHRGGIAPKPTGTKTGKVYKYKGYEIAWDKRRNLWRAKDGINTLYARSHHQLTADIRAQKAQEPQFIETPEA